MSREKWITAAEHMAQLEKDPEWVARNAEREARLKELKRFPPDLNRGDSQRVMNGRVFVH